eukprot:3739241-Prymnesium_polylepis.1
MCRALRCLQFKGSSMCGGREAITLHVELFRIRFVVKTAMGEGKGDYCEATVRSAVKSRLAETRLKTRSRPVTPRDPLGPPVTTCDPLRPPLPPGRSLGPLGLL